MRLSFAAAAFAAVASLSPAAAPAQETRDVQVVHEEKPVYPEAARKTLREGNVVLVGRIDERGVLHDVTPTATTLDQFVQPAVEAAKKWQFRPAMLAGKPVKVVANFAFRFRIPGAKREEPEAEAQSRKPNPMLGEIRIVPADAAGKATGPDGFPLRRGAGERIRVEAAIDVAPQPMGRSLDVGVSALSPSGKVVPLWSDRVTVAPNAVSSTVAFTSPVGPEWTEDGVWRLRFTADRRDAGTAIVWAAADPASFDFAAGMKSLRPWTPAR
ncbi:MAG TPA: energy transducer TonB [Thermoanaerobaculia bacterium]|jgi:TonB family protein